MSPSRASTQSSMACCATVIPTRRTTLSARLARVWGRLAVAIAAWRRQRYEARHLGYLDAASLNQMKLSRSTLRELGVDPQALNRLDRGKFPF